jgi:predicted esterase YcpF (UPF0227 family)
MALTEQTRKDLLIIGFRLGFATIATWLCWHYGVIEAIVNWALRK